MAGIARRWLESTVYKKTGLLRYDVVQMDDGTWNFARPGTDSLYYVFGKTSQEIMNQNGGYCKVVTGECGPADIEYIKSGKTSTGCECGCDVTFGKSNTLHSHWCPMYGKVTR